MERTQSSPKGLDGRHHASFMVWFGAALLVCSAAIIFGMFSRENASVREARLVLFVVILGAIAACALELFIVYLYNKRLQRRFDAEHALLVAGTITDELTGLSNRKYVVDRLESEVARSMRTGSKCSCAVVDIDGLAAINAEFGNAQGDEIIKLVGAILKERLRTYDLIGRYSGEQFLLVLPGNTPADGVSACERFRTAIEKQAADRVGLDYIKLTASFGVAAYEEGDEKADDGLRRAEAALARAKSAGKNRCEV